MADNRLFQMVRSYAAAVARTKRAYPEAIASVVGRAKRRAERQGVDTSRGGTWAAIAADFLAREYAPVDRDFPQDVAAILEWIDGLAVPE